MYKRVVAHSFPSRIILLSVNKDTYETLIFVVTSAEEVRTINVFPKVTRRSGHSSERHALLQSLREIKRALQVSGIRRNKFDALT